VRAAPFFLISIVLGIVTIYYQHGRAIGQETIIVPPYFENGLPSIKGILSRLAVAGMATLFYVATIFWPVNLLPIYTRWEIDPPKIWQLLPIPVILGAAWWFWQNRATWGRNVIFGLGFFVLMVAPVLGFITISYMRITWAADHFIYLPMIGVIALVAAAVAGWYDRLPSGERPLLAGDVELREQQPGLKVARRPRQAQPKFVLGIAPSTALQIASTFFDQTPSAQFLIMPPTHGNQQNVLERDLVVRIAIKVDDQSGRRSDVADHRRAG
jgi:hypothetical protein